MSSRRRPVLVAVGLTFLATAAVAILVGRYLVLRDFPTRAWWIRKDLTGADARETGEYLETVLFSQLSDEAKLQLLSEKCGTLGDLPVRGAFELPVGTRSLSPTGAAGDYQPEDRIPYLRQPLTDLVLRTLDDPAATPPARRHALYFFNILIDLARPQSLESPVAFRANRDRDNSCRTLAGASRLLVPYLAETDLVQKQLAVRALAAMGRPFEEFGAPPPVFPLAELVACATDNDAFVRLHAVRALGFDYYSVRARVGPTLLARFAEETDPAIRVEIVASLGQVGQCDSHDPRPALMAFLNSPRPPKPPGHESEWSEKSPYKRDQWLRVHVLMALSRMPATPQTIAAAKRTFENMTPAVRQLDFAGLAAAAYLGCTGHASVVLPALRWQWAERRKGGETFGISFAVVEDIGLFTFAAAVLEDRAVGRTVTSELITLIPAMKYDCLRFALQPRIGIYFTRRYRHFPTDLYFRIAEDGFGSHGNIGEAWLSEELERLGPPDASDLPALQALLDYNGHSVTSNPDTIAEVRREAAKAILRHRTSVRKAADELPAVIADPATHTVLRAVAEEQRKRDANRR